MLTLSALIPNRVKELFSTKSTENNNVNGDEKEYSLVWYFKMQLKDQKVSGVTIYRSFTKPFNTKIKARSLEEAKEKLTVFATQKCKLEIFEEKDYYGSELGKFDSGIDDVFKAMDKMFETFEYD